MSQLESDIFTPAPKSQTGMRRDVKVLIGLFLGLSFLCAGCVACLAIALVLGADAAVTTDGEITTERGTLVIPGAAYMDGRDLEAPAPLTIMNITVWASAGRRLVKDCTLAHGEEVELLSASRNSSEDRYYLEVRGKLCEGWVSEPFVSPEHHAPVGERVQ